LSDLGKIQRDTEIKRKIRDKISRSSTEDIGRFGFGNIRGRYTETQQRFKRDPGDMQGDEETNRKIWGVQGRYREIHRGDFTEMQR
jgi:hypothetical protein